MRARFLVLPIAFGLTGCGCGDHEDFVWDENEIVFGISQHTADAKTEVKADYEYLRLANKGGWGPWVFRDGDGEGTCYFERLDQRLGRPHVDDGVAVFGGGELTPPGLQILANQDGESKHDGAAWKDGDFLTFDVMGFAMPNIHPITMNAPRLALDITAVTPTPSEASREELSIKASDSVGVTWTPVTEGPFSRVMVSLETDEAKGPGGQVRCFGTAESGSAVIPAAWIARLFSGVDPAAPIKGRLEIASHRQVTIRARASWTVYVVATTVHREQAFVGVR